VLKGSIPSPGVFFNTAFATFFYFGHAGRRVI